MTAALVIGGSGGIGGAVVRRFVAAGRDVTFTYHSDRRSADRIKEQCAEGSVTYLQLDAREPDAIAEVVAACGADLRDVVFASASGIVRELGASTAKHWTWTFEANERAFGLLYRAAIEPLRENGGTLTALTSVGSRAVLAGYVLQGATKAAIEATVRYAAVEAAPFGVRVNAVCAGAMSTRAAGAFARGRVNPLLDDCLAGTPMGRLVTTEEVAELIWFLTSPPASMITGQTIVIDGGWELLGPFSRRAVSDSS